MIKRKFKISGMHCSSCCLNIDGDLEDLLKGVKSSNTNYAKSETEVEFDEEKVSVEKIIKSIENTGYKAQPQ